MHPKIDFIFKVNTSLTFRLIIIRLLDTTFTQVLLLFWKESETIARPLGLHYYHYVSPSVRYQLVKIFVTLEPHGIYLSHLFTYACHWHAKPPFYRQGFAEQLSSLMWSVSENPYKSWTLWDIWITVCILIHFNIVQSLVWLKTVARVCRASFWPIEVF